MIMNDVDRIAIVNLNLRIGDVLYFASWSWQLTGEKLLLLKKEQSGLLNCNSYQFYDLTNNTLNTYTLDDNLPWGTLRQIIRND